MGAHTDTHTYPSTINTTPATTATKPAFDPITKKIMNLERKKHGLVNKSTLLTRSEKAKRPKNSDEDRRP